MSTLDFTIFKTLFGSYLYGTNIASSDKDYKAVGLPNGKQIIMGTAPATIQVKTNTKDYQKNGKDDVDLETFSLYKFLELAKEGQTIFYDMLFSPKELWIEASPEWHELVENKNQLLNKQCSAALGYARAQAERYSIRGERLQALRDIVDFLNIFKEFPRMELGTVLGDDPQSKLKSFVAESSLQFISFPEEVAPHLPDGKIQYIQVCGKKAGFTSSVKFALEIFTNNLNKYGDRAKAASLDGVDWKATYHAYRVASQTEELLLTGNVIFPRPDRALLLKIRNGEMPFEEVSELIEKGMHKIKAAQLVSSLPEKSNSKFIDEFIYEKYLKRVLIGR